jgi:hypothetical protein
MYISKVIHDILSGTTKSQKELCKPDLNLGSQGCHHEKTSHPGIELWTPAYVANILSLDHQSRNQMFPYIKFSSIQNYHGLILAGHFYWFGRIVPSTGILTCTALWEI